MEGLLKFFFVGLWLIQAAQSLELKNGAYDDFVIKVTESVPAQDCRIVLDNLEVTLKSASQYLFSALDSRAFLRSATVLLPPTWPDSCASSPVTSGAGEAPDLTVTPSQGPARGRIYTQQSLGCGQPGDQIFLAQDSLMRRDSTLARSLVKEFAMYRYGVFEEQGYFNDPIYPMCFYDDQTKHPKVTGCSDLPINDNNICSDLNATYNLTRMVDEKARSSIMFAAESPSVSMFCDEGNHDRFAPTKHNSICQRRSVFQVIMDHEDFASNNAANDLNTKQITDTTPKITFKRQILTRYVFVLETTKDMLQRDSWNYLRMAVTYWALNDLPENSEVGIVLAEETSRKVLNLISLKNQTNRADNDVRDNIYSSIPWTPGDFTKAACLHCALKESVEMLNERTKVRGAAQNVIIVIAPGMQSNLQVDKILQEAGKAKIKIASINYPSVLREEPLNYLADRTKGVAYTVFEHKLNAESTLLTTYFELTNVLRDIVQRFHSGSQSDLPIEIHRREITDDGRNSITGSFMLDPNMGMPARFSFFTHDSPPLIKSLKLISPSHVVYANRNDRFSHLKMIRLISNLSEPGTWTYTVEPYPGNPHPHFIQVMATPLRESSPIVRAKFWTHQNEPNGPIILLTEVKRGQNPVLGAKVEVTVTKPEINGSVPYKHKFDLLDSGSGDPDITKGDGVYTRYFSALETGAGIYSFEVVVTDNGNTAYTQTGSPLIDETKPCCGSVISTQGASPISPFQRLLPKITILVPQEQIDYSKEVPSGRVGDLKVQIIPEDMKARLTWTSPDMGGSTVSRYDIKYAHSIQAISDGFETDANPWDFGQPLPLAPGSETTFNLDMSQNRDLLDKPLYFAIKGSSSESSGSISNWVRVLVPSPPPPPTVPPTYSSNEYWPNNGNNAGIDITGPSIAKAASIGLELILPIAIGFLLLVILLVLYCYFCVVKKRDQRDGHKKSNHSIKNDKLSSAITIVPSSPQHHQSNYVGDIPDPHQVGVPIKYDYEEETKKRYSLVNQQEQQLIEELKQQQFVQNAQNYSGLSVISNGSLNRTGHTLSPYNSWSASQLLHEHERRHSPLENMMQVDEHPEYGQTDGLSLNGQNLDHLHHIPPPVPPLPAFNSNGYPVGYSIYGVHPGAGNGQQQNPHAIYQSMQQQRNETLVPFNPSLQGSMSSVNSGDKKRRNVTMV